MVCCAAQMHFRNEEQSLQLLGKVLGDDSQLSALFDSPYLTVAFAAENCLTQHHASFQNHLYLVILNASHFLLIHSVYHDIINIVS